MVTCSFFFIYVTIAASNLLTTLYNLDFCHLPNKMRKKAIVYFAWSHLHFKREMTGWFFHSNQIFHLFNVVYGSMEMNTHSFGWMKWNNFHVLNIQLNFVHLKIVFLFAPNFSQSHSHLYTHALSLHSLSLAQTAAEPQSIKFQLIRYDSIGVCVRWMKYSSCKRKLFWTTNKEREREKKQTVRIPIFFWISKVSLI